MLQDIATINGKISWQKDWLADNTVKDSSLAVCNNIQIFRYKVLVKEYAGLKTFPECKLTNIRKPITSNYFSRFDIDSKIIWQTDWLTGRRVTFMHLLLD